MPAPEAPRPFAAVATQGLSPIDAYSFDVGGYVILRGALDPATVDRCCRHEAACRSDPAAEQPDVYTAAVDGQRALLAPYFHGMLWEGSSFGPETAVLDGPPALLRPEPEPESLLASSSAAGGGTAPPHPYVSHPSGVAFTQGLRCFWALSDGPAGLCVLPASHSAFVDTPDAVLHGGAADDLLLFPTLAAGDLLIAAASLIHGFRESQRGAKTAQQVLAASFISTTARGSAVGVGGVAPTDSVEIPPWGDPSAPLLTDGSTSSWLGPAGTPREHPPVHQPAPNDAVDEVEHWKWDVCGHLVLPGIMDDAWIADAEAALDAHPDLEAARHSTEMTPEPGSRFDDRDSWQQIGPFGGSAAPRLQGLLAMDEPHCRPFRRMITDPRVTQRLTWMMGTHYTIAALPNAIVSVDGAAGVYLHAGGTHVDPTNVYSVVSGRSHVGYINIAWTLRGAAQTLCHRGRGRSGSPCCVCRSNTAICIIIGGQLSSFSLETPR